MENAHLTGAAEGCGSSESGWTKYLSSPTHDRHCEIECVEYKDDDDDDAEDTDDEDGDSVTSDASTGKLHQSHSCSGDKGSSAIVNHPKRDCDDDGDDCNNDDDVTVGKAEHRQYFKVMNKLGNETKVCNSHREDEHGAASSQHSNYKVSKNFK